MNDFQATTVPWAAWISDFEAQDLATVLDAAVEGGDQEQASMDAQDFLAAYFWEPSKVDSLVTFQFFRLGEVAKFYDAFREQFSVATQQALDALYLPFIACWLSGPRRGKLAFDLPPSMTALKHGGLSMALDPDHCQQISRFVEDPIWSEVVWPELLRAMNPASGNVVLEETATVRELIRSAAVVAGVGVLVIFEI